ncbi:hypothetical protein ACVINZ_001558 [Mesorhizobium jarvisii]
MTSATSMIFGVKPKPNHSTTSGAMATSGKVWLTMKTGNSARRSGWKKSTSIDSAKAAPSEQAKPISVARMVGTALSISASRLSIACSKTRDGAGRIVGLMPE